MELVIHPLALYRQRFVGPMNLIKAWMSMVTVVCSGLLGPPLAWTQTDASNARSQRKDRARAVMSQALPALDGDHLKAVLLEVRYGPGEASTPHSHPCAVVGYVVEGSLRTQALVSANASTTEPAKLLAYFICDRDTPLSIDVPEHSVPETASR